METQIATCDNGCNEEFEINETDIKTAVVCDDIEEHYFSCSHCGEKYVAYYTNSEIKSNLVKLKALSYEEKCATTHKQVAKIRNQFVEIYNKNREIQKQIRNLM
jgi:hypothetical protein